MIVACRLPSLNSFIASTIDSARRPASAGTLEPAAVVPPVPWHIAQADTIERTPLSVRLGAAKAGGGGAGAACCAKTVPAYAPARARSTAALRPMGTSLRWGRGE